MKKRWKIFWIVCAVFAVSGIILCITGIAMGANFDMFRKHIYVTGTEEQSYQEVSSSSKFEGINSLEVDASALELNIYPTKEENVIVDFYGNRSLGVECMKEGATLKVDSHGQKKWFGRIPEKNKLDIYIPATVELEKAEFDISAGKVYVKDVAVKNIELDADASDITFEGLNIKEYNYEIDMNAGTLKIGDEKFSGVNMEKYIDNHGGKRIKIDGDVSNICFR